MNENSVQETRDLLVGRRIVAAEKGRFDVAGQWSPATGRLRLDDGTVVLVVPNDGGCACGAGDYTLEHLATVDNAITDVRLADEPIDGDEDSRRYRIYVLADAVEINVMSVEGDDGNGYYGTGYELFVIPPTPADADLFGHRHGDAYPGDCETP